MGVVLKDPKDDTKPAKKANKNKKVDPCPIPKDDHIFNEDFIVAQAPPGARVHKDHFNGRWRLHLELSGATRRPVDECFSLMGCPVDEFKPRCRAVLFARVVAMGRGRR